MACFGQFNIQVHQDGIRVSTHKHCEMRVCPFCLYRGPYRTARKYVPHILRLAAEGHRLQYLTLTESSMPILSRSILDELWACWGRFRRQTLFAGVVATLACMQITRSPNGWHPHLHIILIGGSDISKEAVQTAWYLLTQDRLDGYEVDVRPIKQPDIRRVITYSLRMAPVETAEDLSQLYDSIYRMRLVRATGKLYGLGKEKGFQQAAVFPSEDAEIIGTYNTDDAIDELIAASLSAQN